MLYGYARVSSETQCFNGQIEALKAAGAEQIFAEKFTGKAAKERKQLQALLAKVREGDVVLVCKLDRFVRSSLDLQTMLKDLDDRGVKFKSLGDPIFDTTTPQGKLMMQVLAAFAEFDRNMIRERCSAGLARAKAEGRQLGRKHTLNPHQQAEALRLLAEGETQRGVGRLLGVGQATIARLVASTKGVERQAD